MLNSSPREVLENNFSLLPPTSKLSERERYTDTQRETERDRAHEHFGMCACLHVWPHKMSHAHPPRYVPPSLCIFSRHALCSDDRTCYSHLFSPASTFTPQPNPALANHFLTHVTSRKHRDEDLEMGPVTQGQNPFNPLGLVHPLVNNTWTLSL